MLLILLLTIVNVIIHVGCLSDMIELTPGKMKFFIISDVIIFIGCLSNCLILSSIIWGIVSYLDWKQYGYVFK